MMFFFFFIKIANNDGLLDVRKKQSLNIKQGLTEPGPLNHNRWAFIDFKTSTKVCPSVILLSAYISLRYYVDIAPSCFLVVCKKISFTIKSVMAARLNSNFVFSLRQPSSTRNNHPRFSSKKMEQQWKLHRLAFIYFCAQNYSVLQGFSFEEKEAFL